jgi:hypothetical protein
MTRHAMAVDAVALLIAAIGFHLAFRQRLVRRLWSIMRGQAGAGERREPKPSTADQDPVHYALFISGTMIMAFGVIIFIATILRSS